VLAAQNIGEIAAVARITGGGCSRRFDQAIGNAAHRGHYDDALIPPGRGGNDLRRACNTRRIANRCAAKFHYL
jgi:hypothetical protein